MRFAKIFGLIALVMAAATLPGVGSVSATVLCEETPSGTPAECPAGQDVAANSFLNFWTTTSPLLTTNIANVKCSTSEVDAWTDETGGPSFSLRGEISRLKFHLCSMTSFPFSKCSVLAKNLPYRFEVRWISGTHNGAVRVKAGLALPNPSVEVICAGFINCTFGAPEGMEFEFLGGSPATFVLNKQELTKEAGGFLCPKTSTIDAKYEALFSTAAIWVADR